MVARVVRHMGSARFKAMLPYVRLLLSQNPMESNRVKAKATRYLTS